MMNDVWYGKKWKLAAACFFVSIAYKNVSRTGKKQFYSTVHTVYKYRATSQAMDI